MLLRLTHSEGKITDWARGVLKALKNVPMGVFGFYRGTTQKASLH